MSRRMKVAIAGLGGRGRDVYAKSALLHPDKMEIVAVADIDPKKVALAAEEYHVPKEACFLSAEEMLQKEKLADAMIIATQDRQHVDQAIMALEKGYHLLLEKPISPDLNECRKLAEAARHSGCKIVVCHVLRYTPIYQKVKELLDSGVIGEVVSVMAAENVGWYHQAHSFVRGNWANSDETSPMILQKCCHDMDLYLWLAGKTCESLTSYGDTYLFKEEKAPKGCAGRCLEGCKAKEDCPFDAEKIYLSNPRSGVRWVQKGWPCSVLTPDPTEQSVREALKKGPYGRCVFHCDNDVVDHQTVNLEFGSNIYATFTMTAFTELCRRTIKVTGTLGDIEGDMDANTLFLHRFGQPEQVIDLGDVSNEFAGHGGGDMGLMEGVCELIASGGTEGLTGIDVSVESHVMAMAAEASRLAGGRTVTLAEFCQI